MLTRLYGTPIQAGLLRELFDSDVDIFHANFPSPYLAFNVALASFHRKIPAVLTWHNDLPPVTSGARILIEAHNRVVLPEYIRIYRKIIATSETYRRISPILTRQGGRVVVVNNGVDCHRFNPDVDPSPIETRYETKGRFVVLFVGALTRWHAYKGLDVLLNAVNIASKSIPNLLLLMVGDGDLKPHYQQIAKELALDGKVIFAGNAPDEEIPAYYASCDVLVLSSKDMSEGFGLTLLEANATGRPCIGSNTGGIPEVIQDGFNGRLVPPNDPKTLAQSIVNMAENPMARREMGRNGRKVALSHDWSVVAKKTEDVYLTAMTR
jgi:glycosyltransferase involved in cell wall biosynthesis